MRSRKESDRVQVYRIVKRVLKQILSIKEKYFELKGQRIQ